MKKIAFNVKGKGPLIKNKERIKFSILIYDFIFYVLGVYVFYHSYIGIFLATLLISYKLFIKQHYLISLEEYYSPSFVDFLNHMNSHLYTGTTFENALLKLEPHRFKSDLPLLHRTINIGVSDTKLYETLRTLWPLDDMNQYCHMMHIGKRLGVKPSYITNASLELMSQKQQVLNEIYQTLYQKKMEQMILTFAPMLIILFVSGMSSDFLSILYEEPIGRAIMTFAFGLIIIMKMISEKVVAIKI